MVYIDETGFAPSTCRNYGWAKKGVQIHGVQQANLRPRTSLIGGYLNHRFIAPMLFDGTCNTEVFNQWLLHMLLPLLVTGSVIVMDNATFHKSERTAQIIEDAGCELLFLAPYSPDLNPIEKLWGNIKTGWKYESHLTIEQFLETSHYLTE
jgi:transposase